MKLVDEIHQLREQTNIIQERLNVLAIEKIGKVTLYTANRSEQYYLGKKLYNIKQLCESGIINYLKIELSNPTIILFGSYAKGEDDENSDIDLYIESPTKKQLNLKKYEQQLKRKFEIFQHKNIKEVKNPHLANNIINGITLNKQIEIFK